MEIDWPVVASLAGGGAAGALITTLVTGYRNRRQPIGYRIDKRALFKKTSVGQQFYVTISIRDTLSTMQFDNLYIATIELVNRGNRDITEFKLGFTLAGRDLAILMESFTADRHHSSAVDVAPVPRAPRREIDLRLSPFNRGDSYRYDVYVVTEGSEPGEIAITSPEPVVFRPMPTLGELAAAATRSAVIDIGPFEVRFPR